jgi:hypothetical protein
MQRLILSGLSEEQAKVMEKEARVPVDFKRPVFKRYGSCGADIYETEFYLTEADLTVGMNNNDTRSRIDVYIFKSESAQHFGGKMPKPRGTLWRKC